MRIANAEELPGMRVQLREVSSSNLTGTMGTTLIYDTGESVRQLILIYQSGDTDHGPLWLAQGKGLTREGLQKIFNAIVRVAVIDNKEPQNG